MHGKNGKDILIKVPVGTIISRFNEKCIIVDLNCDNQKYIIAKGGNGGFGNARFKTQNNTAPRRANDGLNGQELNLELELISTSFNCINK